MNGVIYARFSSGPNQTHKSIEGQIRDCTAYADKKGIRIIDTYIDEAISGKDFENRVAFQKMMRDAQKKVFDCVIVWKIDRLGRNREELAMSKARLKRYGVHVHYAMEHIPEGPEGIILESLMEGLAEYYSAELAQKVARGMRDTILSRKTINGKPFFGYLVKDRKYVPDPERAQYAKEIFERYANGESAKRICDDFKRRGIKTVDGKYLQYHSLYKILRNTKYTGLYVYKDIEIPDFHERLISDELFQEVSDMLEQNAKKHRRRCRTENVEYILTGKLYCGKCKCAISSENGTGRHGESHYYYKCSGRKNRRNGCKLPGFRKDDLEALIIQITQKDVLTDEVIDYLVERVMELQADEAEELAVKSMNLALKDIIRKIGNIMNAIEAGIITPTTKDRLQELEAEKERLTIEIAKAKTRRETFTADQVRFYLESFRCGESDNPDFAKNIIQIFVNSIFVYDEYLVMFYNFTSEGNKRELSEYAELADVAVEEHKKKETQSGSISVSQSEPQSPLFESGIFLVTTSVFGVIVNRKAA